MALAARQDHGERLAPALGAEVHLGREAAAAPAERLVLLSAHGARRMLVRAHDGAVDVVCLPVEVPGDVSRALKDREHPTPDPGSGPPSESTPCRGPRAEALRQIAPRRPRAEHPQDGAENRAVVSRRMARAGPLGREQRAEPLPPRVGQLLTNTPCCIPGWLAIRATRDAARVARVFSRMPSRFHIPFLGALAFSAAPLTGAALYAQAPAARSVERPALLIAGGAAGQYDGDRDLGSPGLHIAAAMRVPTRSALAFRVEAQGFEYGEQALPGVVGARGPAERLGAVATLAEWAPSPASRAYVLGGVGAVYARVTGAPSVTTGAGVLGAGFQLLRRTSLEAQYLHAARHLGKTRSLVTARVQVSL